MICAVGDLASGVGLLYSSGVLLLQIGKDFALGRCRIKNKKWPAPPPNVMEPPARCTRCDNAFLFAGALWCSSCRTPTMTDSRTLYVTSISRQLNNNTEPLLHTIARMGKVPLYYYPRLPGANPALLLAFSDNSVEALRGPLFLGGRARFTVLPPTVSHELLLNIENGCSIFLSGYSGR